MWFVVCSSSWWAGPWLLSFTWCLFVLRSYIWLKAHDCSVPMQPLASGCSMPIQHSKRKIPHTLCEHATLSEMASYEKFWHMVEKALIHSADAALYMLDRSWYDPICARGMRDDVRFSHFFFSFPTSKMHCEIALVAQNHISISI